ncbi:MAG: hypothetical protein V4513_06040 [Pseudomonadota bacterium]
MVIRRIRRHVENQNWFAVLIDLAIVVAGVFLGTQANNWNQARIDRSDAAEYRHEIIDDLKSDEVDLASRKAYYGAVRTNAIGALDALQSPNAPLAEPFLVDSYQASQVWLRPLTRTGYDEMVGAGLTRSIGSRETRSRLTAYYTQIKQFEVNVLGTTAFRERLRRALPYAVQSAIRTKCGDRITKLPDGAQVATLPDRCSVGLSRAETEDAVRKLKAADLVEDLTRHIADIDQKLTGFDRFLRQAQDLRLHLQSLD